MSAVRVRAGFYRCGAFCIHRGSTGWGVYKGPQFLKTFATLAAAAEWCDKAWVLA